MNKLDREDIYILTHTHKILIFEIHERPIMDIDVVNFLQN